MRRRSSSITLTLLSAAMLSACVCGGCFNRKTVTLYDQQGNIVPREQWVDANGHPRQLYNADGKPVPPDEVQSAYAATATSHRTTAGGYRTSGGWFAPMFWSSGSRPSSGSTYRSSGGSTYFGGSKPSSGISRGGFGSFGSSSS